ncbi:hypothetical protein CI105_07435 [Candidatus Izimaplasma bacterium ZiA1]|uniref:glycerol-3-phosphate responsive antiterminator n=1 Tax=Candidatus Izimoplasma sp. ZiA1 TaxID=2024899 RepID=UPI000BAA894A|nr:hypothetical protein CI105_07435 [Candidatus Izimaplasma bacterium ZiA1]
MFNGQTRLPALSDFKAIKKFVKSDLEYGILVNFQLAELKSVIDTLKAANKKVLIHVDMIRGLANDEFGAIHLIQNYKVDGLISIKPKVIETAKKRKVIAIQRVFLKDSLSFHRSLDIVKKADPDCLEVLPAMSGNIIKEIKDYVHIDVFCGGLISSEMQIKDCLESGASGITISNSDFW